tara:strand:- start:56 stop:1084 length:1029 start_codon:yes stop_codon:yes gene_type:complete
MTEVSLQFDDVLEGAPIPALVPTLTEEEISVLQNMDIEGNAEEIPQEIKVKAIDHALERVEQGLSPFFNERVGYNEAGLVEKLRERNLADEFKKNKEWQKLLITDPEKANFLLTRAEKVGTIVDTIFVDHQNSKLKLTPKTNEMYTGAQNSLEKLGDIFSEGRKGKTIRWMRNEKNKILKEFKKEGFNSEYLQEKELLTEKSIQNRINTLDKNMNLNNYKNSRNPNKFNTSIMTSGGWVSPDEKGKMHKKYIAKLKNWEESDRTKPKPAKDAGLKSFHTLGKAVDLNRDYYDALGLRGDGQGKVFNEDKILEYQAVKNALIEAGFKQHPKEWWHFSHGEFDY